MTENMLVEVLETAQAKTDGKGESVLPEGRTLTLHAAHAGVSLSISKVESLRHSGSIVRARNTKGEITLFRLEDLFAVMIEPSGEVGASRKAGFLG